MARTLGNFTASAIRDFTAAAPAAPAAQDQDKQLPAFEITSLSPPETSDAVTLHVHGKGFTKVSSILIDGYAVETEYVSSTDVATDIFPGDDLQVGSYQVVVQKPDRTTNSVEFTVLAPAPETHISGN